MTKPSQRIHSKTPSNNDHDQPRIHPSQQPMEIMLMSMKSSGQAVLHCINTACVDSPATFSIKTPPKVELLRDSIKVQTIRDFKTLLDIVFNLYPFLFKPW